MGLYLLNEKTGKRYDVVKFDPEAQTITCKGPIGGQFTEPFDRAKLLRMGYELKQD